MKGKVNQAVCRLLIRLVQKPSDPTFVRFESRLFLNAWQLHQRLRRISVDDSHLHVNEKIGTGLKMKPSNCCNVPQCGCSINWYLQVL
jgi:hypothetical protein